MNRRRSWAASLAPLLFLAGCGGGPHLIPVTGKVTLDGEPVEGAIVTFAPDQANPEQTVGDGTTGPSGEFTLRLDQSRWGVAAGKYKAVISRGETAPADDAPKARAKAIPPAGAQFAVAPEPSGGGGAPPAPRSARAKMPRGETAFDVEVTPEKHEFTLDVKSKSD